MIRFGPGGLENGKLGRCRCRDRPITNLNHGHRVDSKLSLDDGYSNRQNRWMTEAPDDICMRRIDPSRNMARFYVLSIQPTLFGGSSVVREWGRIGTRGRCKLELFDDAEQAERIRTRIERSKRARGYVGVGTAKSSGK